MKFLALILLLLLALAAEGQLPPVPTNAAPQVFVTNNGVVYRRWSPPLAQSSQAVVELRWAPYTNCYFEVLGTTNAAGTNWYHVTNVWIGATNVVLPMARAEEYFTVRTIYQ